jgi:hypothetical protein
MPTLEDSAAVDPAVELVFTDAELTAQALAADPDAPLDDVRPWAELLGPTGESTLPEWYMPPVMRGAARLYGWRRGVVFTFIAALLVIEAFGLCTTYGQMI